METLCVNCKHCQWPSLATGSPSMIEATATCQHPDVSLVKSLVTGREGRMHARHVRRDGAKCGPQGVWFEARGRESGA